MPQPYVCPKCSEPMEPGCLLDRVGSNVVQSVWMEGPPSYSIWTGLRTRGKARKPVTTYRCVGCGYLEFFAKTDDDQS